MGNFPTSHVLPFAYSYKCLEGCREFTRLAMYFVKLYASLVLYYTCSSYIPVYSPVPGQAIYLCIALYLVQEASSCFHSF